MDIGPGDKVICVDDVFSPQDYMAIFRPMAGQIYTIRGIDRFNSMEGIWLEEITNLPFLYTDRFIEPCFKPSHFRPIHSTKTGMAILRKVVKEALEKKPGPVVSTPENVDS